MAAPQGCAQVTAVAVPEETRPAAVAEERNAAMELSKAREHYLRWLGSRDLSPHTIRAYRGDIVALERHFGDDVSVTAIVRERIGEFVAAQRERGLSPISMRRRAASLRCFCRWLVSQAMLDADPWIGIAIAGSRSRSLPRVLSTHDLDRLLRSLASAAHIHTLADRSALARPDEATTLLAVALMVVTGVRVQEVVSIEWRAVDLPGRSVRLLGKGRRERQVYLTNDWITELARRYLGSRDLLGVQHPYLLFNRHRAPLTTATMRSRLAKAARAAGIRSPVTPHMLRHTAATQLIESNVDIRYIQRLLGHASLSTTEIYTHVSNQALRRAVSDADVLGRFLEPR
jgi:site-specific recombinase XerD